MVRSNEAHLISHLPEKTGLPEFETAKTFQFFEFYSTVLEFFLLIPSPYPHLLLLQLHSVPLFGRYSAYPKS